MPCNAELARKLSRQYVCSMHFPEIDFTLGDETSLDRLAVPDLLQRPHTPVQPIRTILKLVICFEICALKIFTLWLGLRIEMPIVLRVHNVVSVRP